MGPVTNLVPFALALVALDREGSIIAALVALIVAALTVSVGAWVLLGRERRAGRSGGRISGRDPDAEGRGASSVIERLAGGRRNEHPTEPPA
jgi:hypothetical protein